MNTEKDIARRILVHAWHHIHDHQMSVFNPLDEQASLNDALTILSRAVCELEWPKSPVKG